MKGLLIFLACIGAGASVQAQLLPVPHQPNPDWTLQKVEAQQNAGIVTGLPPTTDRMPNATEKSIQSMGNHHSVWDAKRQLTYKWRSQPGEMAPDKLVMVHEEHTGALYTYARKSK